jgi:O-antigen/teichoic acid export membrane protein
MSTLEAQRSARSSNIFNLQAFVWDGVGGLVQRLAGVVFLLRIMGAAIAYGSQILLVHCMGASEYGIYIFVWTVLLIVGTCADLGLATASQRLIPEYSQHRSWELLRGFLSACLRLSIGTAFCCSVMIAATIKLCEPWLDPRTIVPLYVACATIPAFALTQTQSGISRSFDWVGLALAPTYVIRQLLLTAAILGLYLANVAVDASAAMLVSAASVWLTCVGAWIVVRRRLRNRVAPGARSYRFDVWLKIAWPIAVVELFFLLFSYVDVLMLKQFGSAEEVAIYYAASKTLALVPVVHFAISATATHRFSEYHAAGNAERLHHFLNVAIKLTFWPSIALVAGLLAAGNFILGLFGAEFVRGYTPMMILAVGLVARASVGPLERLLTVAGKWRACLFVHVAAFGLNLLLCVSLIPSAGMTGAAVASSVAMMAESVLLFIMAKKHLTVHGFIWRPNRLTGGQKPADLTDRS